jgi:hypothetical protein
MSPTTRHPTTESPWAPVPAELRDRHVHAVFVGGHVPFLDDPVRCAEIIRTAP